MNIKTLKLVTQTLVSHNILTNQTFDFQNSAIFAFIHNRETFIWKEKKKKKTISSHDNVFRTYPSVLFHSSHNFYQP